MELVVGVACMAVLVGLYVGLGLADRGEEGCGDCALHRPEGGGCSLYGEVGLRSACPDHRIERGSGGSVEP